MGPEPYLLRQPRLAGDGGEDVLLGDFGADVRIGAQAAGGRDVTRCLYCRAGRHDLHIQSLRLGQTQPDVVACGCDDPIFHKTKENAK